ncbi:hypothetical protein F2Q69_00001877 [Brassica cretica]|uniref:Uncharacterized protein n=2 Tax=Brassica cretica TaxID=69181 RepID=A0A8S9P6K1_BRACR|nr:hypothetical protein F2Q69_00001877 [Brassica cretica]KAF3552191.1 hypothetical protein DY000_02002110 [Brassica cretica]
MFLATSTLTQSTLSLLDANVSLPPRFTHTHSLSLAFSLLLGAALVSPIASLPDKTNTPGCLALFVTVNAIDADALGDGGDELRRSNYRKIEAFIQLLLSKCVSLSFCDCSSMLLVATKALAFAHNKAVHLTTREVHFLSSILASVSSPRVS